MKKYDLSTWRFLNAVTGKAKLNIIALTVAQALLGTCSIFYALLLREIINSAVSGERRSFYGSIIVFVLLFCVQLGFKVFVRFQEEYTKSNLENRFKDRLFTTILSKEYASVSSVHSGEWMNRLTSDTMVVANGLTEILPGLTGMAVKLVGAVLMLIVLEPRVLYMILPGGLLLIVFSFGFRRAMKTLHSDVQKQDGVLRMYLQESLESMLVIRSYGVEQSVRDSAKHKMNMHQQKRMSKNRYSNICNTGFGLMMNGTYVLGAFFCGYGILQGTVSYGTFTAVIQLIGQIQAPFVSISGFLPRFYSMLASCERLMEVEALTDQRKEPALSLEEINAFYEQEFKGLCLQNISFTYLPSSQKVIHWAQDQKQAAPAVLKDFELEIHKGEYVIFNGSSGCGKSTILKLMMCLYDLDRGERYLMTTSGHIPLTAKYQKLFAYVPQGNHLMSGTIREIVAFADLNGRYDDKRLHNALTIACAEFVYELEQGVDTLLGEHGLGLSEGQMQRLAVARAVFSGHPVLFLDEATSALDEATESRLLANLRAMTDRTVILITHRTAAKKVCDREISF